MAIRNLNHRMLLDISALVWTWEPGNGKISARVAKPFLPIAWKKKTE
jgi:hypothetical protein